MTKIKLTDEQFLLLLQLATQVEDVHESRTMWYYLPFWFKRVPEKSDEFEIYRFDQLPEKFKELIKNIRDGKDTKP